jgi:hypothetical protein
MGEVTLMGMGFSKGEMKVTTLREWLPKLCEISLHCTL